MSDLDIGKIGELRVVDLRAELERRGLSKNGVKAELIDRLILAVQQGAPTVLNLSGNVSTHGGEGESQPADHEDVYVADPESTSDNTSSEHMEGIKPEVVEIRRGFLGPALSKASGIDETTIEEPEELPVIKMSALIFEESTNESTSEHKTNIKSGDTSLHAGQLASDLESQNQNQNQNSTADEDNDILIVDVQGSSQLGQDDLNLDQPKRTSEADTTVLRVLSTPEEPLRTKTPAGNESKSGPSPARETRSSRVSQDKKPESKSTGPSPSSSNPNVQTLVVSGFASTTRASDIREAFRNYGKISGVKIISNSRAEGSTRFAHVTISTKDNAAACIETLNNSDMYGSIVSVSRVQGNALDFVKELNSKRNSSVSTEATSEQATATAADALSSEGNACEPGGKSGEGNSTAADSTNTEEKSEKPAEESKESKDGKAVVTVQKLEPKVVSTEKKTDRGTAGSSRPDPKRRERDDNKRKTSREERPHRPAAPHKRHVEVRLRSPNYRPSYQGGRTYYSGSRSSYRGPPYGPDKSEHRLTYEKIRKTREDAVRRDYERKQRDQEQRRKREEEERQRAIQRRNEIELRKLDEEREKLRREREKVEREKQELIRLERLRQQHERERIEKEKEELRRAQAKLAQKRSLGSEKERSRYDEYPEPKRSHVESHSSHRVVPSSHSQAEFSRRPDSRHESTRRVESSGRHDRAGIRVEVDFNDRARARPRERDHAGHASGSGDKRVDSRARDKSLDYKEIPKPPVISVDRVSRDYIRKDFPTHESSSRAESFRAPNVSVDPWARSAYATPSAQSGGRDVWSSSSRKPAGLVSNERQVRVEPAWATNNASAGGYVNRGSPSLLNQHVINPHAGHMEMGGVLPAANSFGQYKVPPAQYRRY